MIEISIPFKDSELRASSGYSPSVQQSDLFWSIRTQGPWPRDKKAHMFVVFLVVSIPNSHTQWKNYRCQRLPWLPWLKWLIAPPLFGVQRRTKCRGSWGISGAGSMHDRRNVQQQPRNGASRYPPEISNQTWRRKIHHLQMIFPY